MKSLYSAKGFILLEVLVAILLLQIGLLGSAELFINSIASCYNVQQSLQALEALRGEMEKVQRTSFAKIHSHSTWLGGFFYTQSVQNYDEDNDSFADYKKIRGRIIWKDIAHNEREFILVTYRSDS